MKGREESDLIINRRIDIMLGKCPNILKKYSNALRISQKATTREAYLRYVKDYLDFLMETGRIDVDKEESYKSIKKSDIIEYMVNIETRKVRKNVDGNIVEVEIPTKEDIRAVRLFAISNFFNFLIEEGCVSENPCSRIEKPKSKDEKNVVFMTPDEIRIVMGNIERGVGNHTARARQKNWKTRDMAILMIGCRTALRVSSIREINIEDIDFVNKSIITVVKGGITKPIYFDDSTEEILKKWISERETLMEGFDPCDALFISSRRTRMTRKAIADMIKKYTSNIDKHITPHKMRSSCLTNLYMETKDIYLVQEIAGHRNIENTKRYVRPTEDMKRGAAKIMDNLY